MMVETDAAEVVIAGGVESMSNIEYYSTAMVLRPEPSFGATMLVRCKTLLFVPGNRPERFEKALAALAAWLDPKRPVIVRVNPAGSEWFDEDLATCRLPGVMAIAHAPSI
jgi:hypothetical protein